MRRFVLHFSILVLTFVIGTYANALVLRAAYRFIPDYDPLPAVEHVDQGPNEPTVIGCGPKVS